MSDTTPTTLESAERASPTALRAREEKRLETLLSLLGDDSPTVDSGVRQELQRLGKRVRPALERAARAGAPEIRGRAREVLLERERERAVRRLLRYASRRRHDLETALFLLDRYQAPSTDLRAYGRALDAMGTAVERRAGARPRGRRRVEALVDYLTNEIGFGGAENDYHHPHNICLYRTIERRMGMPLTLCAVWSFVARRAGLNARLLPFPGHVLLLIREGGDELLLDPFGGGKVVSEEKCLAYLAVHHLPHRKEFFRPASDTAMFMRQVLNLIQSCRMRQRHREAHRLERLLHILSRHPAARVAVS